MVERLIDTQRQHDLARDRHRCLLYRIFDPTDSGSQVVVVGYDKVKNEPVKDNVKGAFNLSGWSVGSSFIKAQKMKFSNKDLNDACMQLCKPELILYGRLQAAMDVLMKTTSKWMTSKGELNLTKLFNISDKPDQLYRVQAPDRKVMDSFSDERLEVLLLFLDQLQDDVRPRGKALDQSKFGSFKSSLSVIAACYAKLMYDRMNSIMTPALQGILSFEKVNEICEQLTLCTDLFGFINQDCPAAFNVQACSSMLYISQIATGALKATICERPREFPLSFQILAEQIIFSSLMVIGTLLAPEMHQMVGANGLEDVLLGRGTQIMKFILQMVPHLPNIFNGCLNYPEGRHFMNFAQVAGRRSKPRTLLKIVLNTLNTACSRWQDKVRPFSTAASGQLAQAQKEQVKVFDNFQAHILHALDQISLIQIAFYMKTESIKTAQQEPEQPKVQEESKTGKLNKDDMGKIEEADSEGEDEGSEKEEKEEEKDSNAGEFGQHHEDETLKYSTEQSAKSDTVVIPQKWVKHTSIKLLSDPSIAEKHCQLDAAALAQDDAIQRNWISTNHEIFEITRRLLPGYYKDIGKQRDEIGLETSPKPIKIDDEQSYLMNVCNLFKIQFYFLLRFNHYNTYSKFQSSEKSAEISPQDERTQCNLTLSIKKFFQMINQSHFSFNQQILAQIYDVCKTMVENNAFDVVDPNYFFQVLWLNQMINQLSYLSDPDNDFNEKSMELFKSLYSLFKSFFIEDKYLHLLESVFELDFDQLYHIESKLLAEDGDLKISKINRFLIQRYSIILIVRMCSQDRIINLQCWQKVQEEFTKDGMCYAIATQSDSYDEIALDITLPQGKGVVKALEYRHKTTRSVFKTEIYMMIKLVMGLIGLSDMLENSRRIYHILIEDPNHFEHFHKGEHPVLFHQPSSAGNTPIRLSSPPIHQDQLIGDKPTNRNCEDCLRCQFQQFKLSKMVQLDTISDFWKFLIDRIKQLSTSLKNLEQAKEDFFNPESVEEKATTSKPGASKSAVMQKKIEQSSSKRTYKITEKIYSILKRFVVFASQNKKIAEYLRIQFNRKPEVDSSALRNQASKLKSARHISAKEEPKNLNGQDYKDIQDLSFKVLLLRNLMFHTRFISPDVPEEEYKFLTDSIANAFRQIKWNWNVLVKLQETHSNREREKSTLNQIFENFIETDNQTKRLSQIKPNPYGQSREQWLDEKVKKFREAADISNSLLNLYINVVCKTQSSIILLSLKPIINVTIVLLRKIVFAEGTFAVEFIQELLQAFFFDQVEEVDSYKLMDVETHPILMLRNNYNYSNSVNPILTPIKLLDTLLKLIFDSVIEFIRICKDELLISVEARKDFRNRAICMIKLLVSQLHQRIFSHQHAAFFTQKFSRSLKKDCISQLKKILIFLREQGQQDLQEFGRDVHQTEATLSQLRQIIVRSLSVMPNPRQMRDFFAFFRDIFYYNQKLDQVDFLLVNDTLSILNDVLKKKSEQLSQECERDQSGAISNLVPLPGAQSLRMMDSFMFSKSTPGTIVLNNFRLNKEPSLCLTFKLDVQELMHEAKKGFTDIRNRSTDIVILSFMQKYAPNDPMQFCGKTLDIKLRIRENRDFNSKTLQYMLLFTSENAESEHLPYRDVDSEWHFLFLRIKLPSFQTPILEVYLDSFDRESKNSLAVPLKGLNAAEEHYMAMGNNVETLCKYIKDQSVLAKIAADIGAIQTKHKDNAYKGDKAKDLREIKEKEKQYIKLEGQINANFEVANNQFFRGNISLPFFMCKVSDMQKNVLSDPMLGRAFKETLIEFINKKLLLKHDGPLDLNYQMFKLHKQQDTSLAIMQANGKTKQIYSEYDLSEQALLESFSTTRKKNTNYQIKQFESLDKYTMQVIHLHSLNVQNKALMALHQRSPAEVFACLGGFKNLYPLVDKVVKSNLVSIHQTKPGQVLSWFFIILNTILHANPDHINMMVKQRNLMMTLKMILLNLGTKQMITVELLNQVKNVIRKNVLARFRFVKMAGKNHHFTQRYIHTANGTCRENKAFYESFLESFMNMILLDEDISIQECFYVNSPHVSRAKGKAQSSTTTSVEPVNPSLTDSQIRSHLVIDEFIDLIQSICSPPEMMSLMYAQQQKDKAESEDAYIDFESLRDIICVGRETNKNLMKLLGLPQLQNIKHMQLLQKLGKCIADSIIFRQDTENLKTLLNAIQNDMWRQLSPLILKVYLLIILRVLNQTSLSQKENKLVKVLTKDLKQSEIAKILNQSHPKEAATEETLNLQDEVVSIVLLILVEHYLKGKQQDKKIEHYKNVSPATRAADSERKELVQLIQQELVPNQHLRNNTYFTLMLIAMDKSRVDELSFSAIPKIDEIIELFQNTKLRQEDPENPVSTFDIDFFFLVLEQFRRYHLQTKRVFLTHLHHFLEKHMTAFMLIFEERTNDNMYRKKLLAFFFMIISECITSTDENISTYAENILLEVCFFQLKSNTLDLGEAVNAFTKQQMNSFIQEKDKKPSDPKSHSMLKANDYSQHKLLTQILMFFKNDNNQFQILVKLLTRVYRETGTFEDAKDNNSEIIKLARLNLKVLQLLQIVEQIFVTKPYVSMNDNFIEALVMMMHFLEKLGILDFALPDKVSFKFIEAARRKKDQTSETTGNPQETKQPKQSITVGVMKQEVKPSTQIKSTNSASLRSLAELGMPIKNAPAVLPKDDFKPEPKQTVIAAQMKRTDSGKGNDKFFVFLCGGSFRMLMHIIMKSVNQFGNTMKPEQFATYMDMIRFLVTKETSLNIKGIVDRHFRDDGSNNVTDVDFKLRKINLLNRADVLLFIASDSGNKRTLPEELKNQSSGLRETGKVQLSFTEIRESEASVTSKSVVKSLTSRMRTDQIENTCWKIYRREKTTIVSHQETLDAIQRTIDSQINIQQEKTSTIPRHFLIGSIDERLIKDNLDFCKHIGYNKRIFGILPGVGMVKGFCLAMLIGELVEVLNTLMYPREELIPDARLYARSEAGLKRVKKNSSNQFLGAFPSADMIIAEAENEDDKHSEMSFEEETKQRSKPSQSFKRSTRVDYGFIGRLSRDEIYQKVDDLLFFVYEALSEQLFQMPLPISNTPEKRRSFRAERPNLVDFDEDQSLFAGKVFWNAIDPLLKKELEAQIAYFASREQFGLSEAKAQVSLFGTPREQFKKNQNFAEDYFKQEAQKNHDTEAQEAIQKQANDLTGTPDDDRNQIMLNPTFEFDNQETNERNSFVDQYIDSNKEGSVGDQSQIINFISHLFIKLHSIYGLNTKITNGENGGFDFKDRVSQQLVMNIQNKKQKNQATELADICDYVLHQQQMVAIAFSAVCSDIFKDELNRVYQIADLNIVQQQKDEQNFEKTRKETGTARKIGDIGLELAQNLKNKVFSSQQFTPGTFNLGLEETKGQSEEKAKVQTETPAEIVEFKTDDVGKKAGKLSSMFSLDYMSTKKNFKRIVKWCEEDCSNMWYDHMEQEAAEFADIKSAYKQETQKVNIVTAETERISNYKKMLAYYDSLPKDGNESKEKRYLLDYKSNYGEIFPNPQFHNVLVKQRRQSDKWGRKLLIKPNRKYYEGSHYAYYKYFAQEFLHKMFAVSLLEDTEQPDCLVPQSQKDFMLDPDSQNISMVMPPSLRKTESQATEHPDHLEAQEEMDPFELAVRYYEDPNQLEHLATSYCFSKNLQRMRNDLFARLERSRFLKRVLYAQPENKESLRDDEKREKRKRTINAILRMENPYSKDDLVKLFDAEIYCLKSYSGTVMITSEYLVFLGFGLQTDHSERFKINQYDISSKKKTLIYRWNEIEEMIVKPFIGPMIGVEVFVCDKTNFTLNFLKETNLKQFMNTVEKIKKQQKSEMNLVENPIETFKQNGYAESWKNSEKSNQEFLLLLNKYSGRGFSNINAYPFFPHVLVDFDSMLWEFHEEGIPQNKVYRDFKRTTINMFEEKDQFVKAVLDTFENNEVNEMEYDKGYMLRPHYGYSTNMRTVHHLTRLEPFSSLYQDVNGGKENPDRIIYSFQLIMKKLKEHDSKFGYTPELMPEFFYLPEIYTNENCCQLGLAETDDAIKKTSNDTWLLPKWALNHYDLVKVLRESLESKYVQENLGAWIDLQFGCDQFKRAIYNEFYPWNYPEWWNKSSDFFNNWKKKKVEFETKDGSGFDIQEFLQTNHEDGYILAIIIASGFQVPLKLLPNPVMQTEKTILMPDDPTIGQKAFEEESKTDDKNAQGKKGGGLNIDNLINHFVANIENPIRGDLKLNRCADYQVLDSNHDIIHMIIISLQKQCLAFLRVDDSKNSNKELPPGAIPTGKIVVYCNRVNISRDTFNPQRQYDLFLRYEHVHHELDNIFAEFSCKTDKCIYKKQRYLFVGGYLDNTIKIFDLEKKPGEHLVRELKRNNARVTCIKFSKDYKYLITCDADGVIQHYEKNCHMSDHADVNAALNTTVGEQSQNKEKKDSKQKKEHFPFTLLHTIQDQMSEIVALDINDTLDMYVTLSRDGTIALRCLRTSKLWRQFKILYKLPQNDSNDKTILVRGFIKNFKHISALKLSLHGYIIVCGPSSRQSGVPVSQYLVYSINGDLLRCALEKVEIKNVFLNSREDQLIIATNFTTQPSSPEDKTPPNINGNLRVLSLYGLEKVANLTKVVYIETISFLQNDQHDQGQIQPQTQTRVIPSIQAMVVGQAERNINIFFVKKQLGVKAKNESKEIICFDSGMDAVWSHFKNYGIAR